MITEFIEIVNPTAVCEIKRTHLAPRKFASLQGRRIGLLDNNKPNADKFLEFLGELLEKRYDGIELILRHKMTRTETDCLSDLRKCCDAVVNAFAD